jgi:transposase
MTPSLTTLLDLPPGYVVRSITVDLQQVTITLASTAVSALCPRCDVRSSRLHSHYQRTVADAPCAGRQIMLHVQTQKWRCLNSACSQRVFAERLGPFIRVSARMTTRLRLALEQIGAATNGEQGTRLAGRLGMPTSPSTLLRCLLALPDPASPPS